MVRELIAIVPAGAGDVRASGCVAAGRIPG
jgi:hypothetical protein